MNRAKLKHDCDRALSYLYLACHESIADDVRETVNAYTLALEARVAELEGGLQAVCRDALELAKRV